VTGWDRATAPVMGATSRSLAVAAVERRSTGRLVFDRLKGQLMGAVAEAVSW
jgi:hypothetical protein